MRDTPESIFKSVRATVLIYAGVVFTVVVSMIGLVIEPERQLGGLAQAEITTDPVLGTTGAYPPELTYGERLGRDVYRAMGCIYCHTQQVRPDGFGADIERGWGIRRTVARDYIHDQPHLLGTMRTGPDLANIGARQPERAWHHRHLYDPRSVSPGSIMPAFRFLYDRIEVARGQTPPDDAISLADEPGVYIVPKPDARRLYEYLMTLDKSPALPEAE